MVNLKKVRRLYAEERLKVKRRKGRKKASGTRAPLVTPQAPNQRWSLDFVSDVFAFGRRFLVLAVIDAFSAECLCSSPIPRSPDFGWGVSWTGASLSASDRR